MIWWSECITTDVEGARDHYAAIFSWKFEAMPMPGGEGTYWIAKLGDRPVAGIMSVDDLESDQPVPPHWMTYVAVDDMEHAVDAAVESGGTVVRPPFDVPGVGTIAMVLEPGGALLGIMTPVEMISGTS
ncbi:MAG: VOC family protein [Pseudomonadota bacterium]